VIQNIAFDGTIEKTTSSLLSEVTTSELACETGPGAPLLADWLAADFDSNDWATTT